MTTSPRAARRGLVHGAAVWALALGLCLLGGAANRVGVPLLTAEAPDFLFGAICAWLVFVWCGRLPGVCAALGIALLGAGAPAAWTIAGVTALGLFVVQAWGVTALAARTGSVIVGAVLFWLVSAPLLVAGHWLVGASSELSELAALGLVVGVFNALINACVVEVLVRIVPLPHSLQRTELAASPTLEHYLVRRILPVVIVPVLVIGLFHTRTQFDTLIEQHREDVSARPDAVLQGRMVQAAVGVLALATALLAGLYLVVLVVARHIAVPLVTLRQTTATIAAGRFERLTAALEGTPIRELRSISTDLGQLRTTLHAYDRRRRAKEQETEARLRHTFEQAAVGLAHVSLRGIWLRVNTRLCEILGYTPDDLLGHSLETMLQPEDCERVEALMGRVITGQDAIARVELALVGADGRPRWTHWTLSLGRDATGEPDSLILVLEDLSARRALEEQLRRSQKLERVGRLAGGVAHDFNNWLTAIIGYSDFLSDALGPHHRQRDDVEQIRDAARRAARLTRELLAFARQQVLDRRVLNVNDLISRMHHLIERLMGDEIDLRLDLTPTLANVNADAGQLEQVLLNLVVNARDAMPDGGRLRVATATVWVNGARGRPAALAPGEYVQLTVADSGHGMSDEVRARAFEPFFTTKGAEDGTGLGLASCSGIVKQLGGEIEVESEPGQGTVFRILLPATHESIEPDLQLEMPAEVGSDDHVMRVADEQIASQAYVENAAAAP